MAHTASFFSEEMFLRRCNYCKSPLNYHGWPIQSGAENPIWYHISAGETTWLYESLVHEAVNNARVRIGGFLKVRLPSKLIISGRGLVTESGNLIDPLSEIIN